MSRWLLAMLLVCPVVAAAADQKVLGKQLVLKNTSTPDRRTLVVEAREVQSQGSIVGDPVTEGAFVTITTRGGTPGFATYALPSGPSAVTGKPFWTGDVVRGFTYRDTRGENGPVKTLQMQLRGTFRIKVQVTGRLGAVTLVPPDPGSSGCMLLAITGGDSYSVAFAGGKSTNVGARSFKITNPTQKGSCVEAPMGFEDAAPLQAGGASIDLDVKAVPRLVDWNGDGVLDLLVFSGDGYIRRYMAAGATTSTSFQPAEKVQAGGADIRVSTGYTGGAFTDMDGDLKPDLVVAGDDDMIRIYRNIGTARAPVLDPLPMVPMGATGVFMLPPGCYSRIDVADWDGDGLKDVVAGAFGGTITFHRNTGTASVPAFAAGGQSLTIEGQPIGEAYNTHPRVYDFTRDGVRDLAYGVNWHYFQLCPSEATSSNDLRHCFYASDRNAQGINLRSIDNDDSCPDFADLDGDGVLDMVDGGLAGRVVVLRGRHYSTAFPHIEQIMNAHPVDLGPAMGTSASLRDDLFGLHQQVWSFVSQLRPDLAQRVAIRDWYAAHIAAYPQYLRWQTVDQQVQKFIPMLAGQCWLNLFESMPDTASHRDLVAFACGFSALQSDLVTDAGTIFIENHRSSVAQRRVLHDLQMSLPDEYRVVEAVSIGEFLLPAGGPNPGLRARTGINIFSEDVGVFSEGFPSDVPETLIDQYSVAIAHELNHNVEAPAAKLFPEWYRQRKSELLKEASPPHYRWKDHPDGTHSWDVDATKQVFLTNGYWNGNPSTWTAALDTYWSTGPGSGYDRHWCRDNLRYSIENPGEAFATLSNQYFDSSEVMLQLGLVRYANGNPWCLDEFLFFAEVYAVDRQSTPFYRVDTEGNVGIETVAIRRGPGNHINGLTRENGTSYDFSIAANGDVLAVLP